MSERKAGIAVAVFGLALAAALAGGIPDLELNPASGSVESVDLDPEGGSRIRHVEDAGQDGGRTAILISSASGLAPRIAINAAGESWVVWWEDGQVDRVHSVHRSSVTGAWTAPSVISSSDEDSRNPEIVHNGSHTWVAYEIHAGATTSIAVTGIIDTPEPFPGRTVVATTTFGGDVDVLVHAEAGHVWITWIDGASALGWSEWSAATSTWGVPQYESYAGSGIVLARREVRNSIVEP